MLSTTLPFPEAPRTPAEDRLGSGASEIFLNSQAERGRAQVSLPLDHPASSFYCVSRHPRLALDAEESVLMNPHGPTIEPRCPEGVAYQYKVLPFGLSLAPRTFTRCMDLRDTRCFPLCNRWESAYSTTLTTGSFWPSRRRFLHRTRPSSSAT